MDIFYDTCYTNDLDKYGQKPISVGDKVLFVKSVDRSKQKVNYIAARRYGKVVILDSNNIMVKEGYYIITEIREKEKCIIVNGIWDESNRKYLKYMTEDEVCDILLKDGFHVVQNIHSLWANQISKEASKKCIFAYRETDGVIYAITVEPSENCDGAVLHAQAMIPNVALLKIPGFIGSITWDEYHNYVIYNPNFDFEDSLLYVDKIVSENKIYTGYPMFWPTNMPECIDFGLPMLVNRTYLYDDMPNRIIYKLWRFHDVNSPVLNVTFKEDTEEEKKISLMHYYRNVVKNENSTSKDYKKAIKEITDAGFTLDEICQIMNLIYPE